MDDPIPDPYLRCDRQCNHDLAGGVLLEELLTGDGPHPPSPLIVSLSPQRALLLDDEYGETTNLPVAAGEAV